jgi:hypothetical protein
MRTSHHRISAAGNTTLAPVELDADGVRHYDSAKAVWHEAHSRFVRAVKTAQDSELIDW